MLNESNLTSSDWKFPEMYPTEYIIVSLARIQLINIMVISPIHLENKNMSLTKH